MTEQLLRNIFFAVGAIFGGIMLLTMIIAFIRGIDDDNINSEMERRKNGPFPRKRNPKETFTFTNFSRHIYRDDSIDLRNSGNRPNKTP